MNSQEDVNARPIREPGVVWIYAILAGWLLAGIAILQLQPVEVSQLWLRENGPIETLSAFGYFVCASILFWWFGRTISHRWYMPVLVISMGLRELDFHSRFTTMSVSKLRFYTSGQVPWLEKLLVIGALGALGWAGFVLVRRHGRTVLPALRSRSFVMTGVVLAAGLAVFSKLLDGLPRKLAGVGLRAPDWLARIAHDSEEILELGIPLMLTTALVFHIFTHTQPAPLARME